MTIKECAAALGLTKAGVRYWMNRINEPMHKDETGRVSISAEVFQRLQTAIRPESTVESGNEQTGKQAESDREVERESESIPESAVESGSESGKQAESGVTAALVEMLREELRGKNEQIASLTAQLENVTEALKTAQRSLEQAQILHAKSVNLLPDAQTEQTEPEPGTVEAVKDESPKRRRGLFGWVKKRG